MCWELHVMEGSKVVRRIATVAQAVDFFGADNVLLEDEDGALIRAVDDRPEEGFNYCLCPIDKDELLARTGYVRVEDERYDSMNTRIEKIQD